MSHIILTGAVLLVVIYPFRVSANAKATNTLTFANKVKAMFIAEKVDNEGKKLIAAFQHSLTFYLSQLQNHLKNIPIRNAVLLFMSSGNYDGIDIPTFAHQLIQTT